MFEHAARFGLVAGLVVFLSVAVSAEGVDHKTSSEATQAKLSTIIASEDRTDADKARDKYRHPLETLTFLGIEPEMTFVELQPGDPGWYRVIIEPLIGDQGTYIGINDDFVDGVEGLPYGEVDMVFAPRTHGFIFPLDPRTPGGEHDYLAAIYKMLKPGGLLGIVDHAGDESIPQDPMGVSGYVNESYFIQVALKAGFRLLAVSEINRNPKDRIHHPAGVYSLPPSKLADLDYDEEIFEPWEEGSEELAKYLEIGESDRFTHLYYKPLTPVPWLE